MSDGAPDWEILVQTYEGLAEAENADDFYRCLAILIGSAKMLPDSWLAEMTALVGAPWKRSRGRPANNRQQDEIEWEYFHRHLGGLRSPMPERVDAVADIVQAHARRGITITDDAAKAIYDKAAKGYAAKPYALGGARLMPSRN